MDETPSTRPSLLVRLRDPRTSGPGGSSWRSTPRWSTGWRAARGSRTPTPPTWPRRSSAPWPRRSSAGTPTRRKGSFRGWLFRIARNLMVNPCRRAGAAPEGDGRHRRPAAAGAPGGPVRGGLRPVRGRVPAAALRLGRRPGPGRVPRGRPGRPSGGPRVEGQDAEAVADALGMTVGAVYIAKSRVMARLRQAIERGRGGVTDRPTGRRRDDEIEPRTATPTGCSACSTTPWRGGPGRACSTTSRTCEPCQARSSAWPPRAAGGRPQTARPARSAGDRPGAGVPGRAGGRDAAPCAAGGGRGDARLPRPRRTTRGPRPARRATR